MRTAIAGVLLLAATAVPATAQQPQGWAEKMFQEGTSHDFGTVPHGAQLYHRFAITNIYAVRMDIIAIQPGCGCVTATATERILQPRQTAYIDVTMDARRFTGGKSVSILVTVGPDYRSTAELKVIANSRGDIVFNPGEVNFATVSRGQVVTQTVDVEYAGALPWQVTEVLVAKELPLEASFKELYRKPGQVGVRVNVTLKADAPPGALKEYVYLKTNDPAGPLVPVLVEAQVVGAVTVSPSALALGTVKAGEEVTKRVVVRGSKPFKVLGVEGGSDVTLVGELAAEAPAQTVTLKIKPEQAGDFKREVKIRTSLQSEPVVVVIDGSVTP